MAFHSLICKRAQQVGCLGQFVHRQSARAFDASTTHWTARPLGTFPARSTRSACLAGSLGNGAEHPAVWSSTGAAGRVWLTDDQSPHAACYRGHLGHRVPLQFALADEALIAQPSTEAG